ncbi:WD40 repeat domain-containing protein [Micromonospora sp. NPDC047134]|uniref:WD40 repeat domain-containing protein n=1 Tax=Micromonospora sp. NPDC047134 TaxID=3154340 RepID=UPI0033ECF28C
MTSIEFATNQPDVPDHAALTGAAQDWLKICARTLRESPGELGSLLTADHPYSEIFAAGTSRWYDRDPLEPEGADVPDLGSARAILAVAEALAEPRRATELLAPALAHWRRANVLPDDAAMTLPKELFHADDEALRGVLQRAGETGGAAAGLAALLAVHLNGGEIRRGQRVEVPVLFDRNIEGGTAVLSLTVAEEGPAGLYPDPACMLFLASDAGFRRSLTAAWRSSDLSGAGVCVLWAIRMRTEPCNDVVRDSLGAAFGAGLDELRRSTARFGRLRLRRLHPRRAITGGLDDDGRVTAVGGLDTKFAAAERAKLRVIVPRVQQAEADGLRPRHPALRRGLYYAIDLDEALAGARWFDARQMALAAALVLVLVLGGFIVNRYNQNTLARSELAARAATLTSKATLLKQTDPRLAGLLALAAHQISPGVAGNADALRDILATNENVIRSWKASPSLVDTVAVDVSRSRIYTSGDDDAIKAWELETGAEAGRMPGSTARLVVSPYAPVLAAMDSDRIRLFNVADGTPEPLGQLPENFCAQGQSTIVAAGFIESGATVLAVWTDGAITTWDTMTKEAGDCWRLRDAATDKQLGEVLPGRLVLDASVVPSDEAWRGAEDRILVLLNQNRVLDIGARKHGITVALDGDELAADATHVRGTAERLAVGTSAGVLLWDRTTKRNLAFPLGGLSSAVTALDFHDDRLVIAGTVGAAVIPDFLTSAGTGRSASTPRGGRVGTAAVGKDGTIVVGGADGRVAVLGGDGGNLTLPALAPANTAAYTPDGALLLNNWSHGRSSGLFTVRPTGEPGWSAPTGVTYRHERDYGRSRSFYINDTAVSATHVAAVGQINNDTAAVVVWPAGGGSEPYDLVIPTPDDAVREAQWQIGVYVAFAPEANLMVARHLSGQVAIWDTTTWARAAPVDLRPGNTSMAIHGTRGVFTDGGDDRGELVMVDLVTRQELHRIPGPNTTRLDWSDDGTRIVSMRDFRHLQLYDGNLNTIGAPWQLPGGGLGSGVAISPDGTRVAVSQESRVYVYDLATREQAMVPLVEPDGNDVVSLAWSPDGGTLLGLTIVPTRALKEPGPVRRWLVADREWQSQICRWAGGGLSRDEWREHVGGDIKFVDLCRGVK